MSSHPHSLALLLLCLPVACGEPQNGRAPDAPRFPNVLLLVSDDQGLELGAYGARGPQTPNLDRLAAEGCRFTRAYATAGVCTPSRTSLYTGLYPTRNGATGFSPVRADVRVWGEVLSEVGYRTGLIGKLGAKPIARFHFDFKSRTNPDDARARSVKWHVETLRAFLAEDDGRPFCLLVNFRDSHFPFPTDGAPTGWKGARELPHDPATVSVPPFLVDRPEVREELAAYYDGLRRMDVTVGALLETLEQAGLARETLVIFTSDHGMPYPLAKTTLYEAGIRVPLLVRWPGVVAAGRVEDALVSLVDVLPTLVELSGQRVSDDFDGRSLAPLLRAEATPWRDAVFASHTSHRREPELPSRAVRVDNWKYIRNFRTGPAFENGVMLTSRTWRAMVAVAAGDPEVAARVRRQQFRPPQELFDLAADPHELQNLVDDPTQAGVLSQLQRRLREFMQTQHDPLLDEWEE